MSGYWDLSFLSMSWFCISSLVGRPICFWRWSNIIFSTVCLVSGSRSESLLLSGLARWVSISGSPLIRDFHHSLFVSSMDSDLPSSMLQKQSSTLTGLWRSPSMMGGWPLSPTLRWSFLISHRTNLALVPSGTGMERFTSGSCCDHEYLSRSRPLPAFGCLALLSSFTFSISVLLSFLAARTGRRPVGWAAEVAASPPKFESWLERAVLAEFLL
uniref:Uncharacterized protein n=1 Tax=Triticum urartu TaxID=4572 RepID=A0A8R7U122_TRIUA